MASPPGAEASAGQVGTATAIDEAANDVANRVISNLSCACGRDTCDREALKTCNCKFAARMRRDVRARLGKYDLSTAPARKRAYEEVLASMVATYGPDARARKSRTSTSPLLTALPIFILLGGTFAFVLLARRLVRRSPDNDGSPEQ